MPLESLSCQMRRVCQTFRGHTKKCLVMLMPKSPHPQWWNGGPKFPTPPRVAWAACSLRKLGRTISSAMCTRQVSSAMAPLAFVAASWRMALPATPSVVQLPSPAPAQPSLSLPSRNPLRWLLQVEAAGVQAAFAGQITSASSATITATSNAATMEGGLWSATPRSIRRSILANGVWMSSSDLVRFY